MKPVHVIGGGLAGSEAAWQIASAGVPVVLHEMRGVRGTDAHKTDGLAELVCSNSFRSDDAETNAVGLLHAEMRLAGSLIMASGDANQVPAGGALAVDRDGFSDAVTATSLAEAKKQGPVFAYGNFITVVINFLILAFIIFLMVKMVNNLRKKLEKQKEAAPAAPPPADVQLLTEIRDLLSNR